MSTLDDNALKQLMREERSAIRRTIRSLLSLLIAPILLTLILGAVILYRDLEMVADAKANQLIVELSTDAEIVATELQKERGVSAGFIGSGGAEFVTELEAQRQATDEALASAWTRATNVSIDGLLAGDKEAVEALRARVGEALAGLSAMRSAVSALSATKPELLSFYTTIIVDLISVGDYSSGGERDSLTQVYQNLLFVAEYAGRERAAGAGGFANGAFDIEDYAQFTALAAAQRSLFERLGNIAPPKFAVELEALLNDPVVERVETMRRIARASVQSGDVGGVSGPEWFEASTQYISAVKAVARKVANEVHALAVDAAEARTLEIYEVAAALILTTIGSIILGVYQSMRVATPLKKLTRGLQRMARGLSDIWIDGEDRKDIVGILARSTLRIAKQGEENTQVRSSLNVSQAMLMIADVDDQIIFINGALEAAVEESMDYFMEALDDFDPFQMYAHIFEMVKAASREEGFEFATLEERKKIEIEFAERVFVVNVTAVRDAAGRYAGVTVEWTEVTASRQIEAQLAEIIDASRQGDFSRQIDVDTSDRFFRTVADGMNAISAQVNTIMGELNVALGALAEGDLTKRVNGEYEGDLGALADAANTTIDRLRSMVARIASGGVKIQANGGDIRDSSQSLAQRAEDAASSLEETAAAMEELSATAKSTAAYASEANTIATEASASATRGGEVVEEAIAAMQRIKTSSDRITEIVSVIDSIAFQTNLLALNAAVEAARAGEAGKGFAVVAQEVRTLAQRSSEAARDIRQLIDDSSTNVTEGVDLVEATGASLQDIVRAIQETSTKIDEIARASNEQSIGAGGVPNGEPSRYGDAGERRYRRAERVARHVAGVRGRRFIRYGPAVPRRR